MDFLHHRCVDFPGGVFYSEVMLVRVYSCAVLSLEGVLVEVEVDFGSVPQGITIVGLPDASVQESCKSV